MFKIESYITPILLSYVDKYIKNFRPEDSQVSLWGGDVSFHNLDLRLEVLEEELQLPFCFVSGHIHELLIHVPWTKLASEPITITINTIECILKLRGSEEANQLSPDAIKLAQMAQEKARKAQKRHELEAPTGYVQSLINKIVGNIRIYCNNLILKYVEEDIVLSMNVKLLTFQSADSKWKAAFTDVGQGYVTQRKIINVLDLTVCLDKRNASGKIDVYQEPMLYRCSMVVHFLRCYHSATAKKASTIRVDLYCKQMEFSMTEQQIPMLIRLIHLILALHRRELIIKPVDKINFTTDHIGSKAPSDDGEANSWAGWAWSFVPAVGVKDEEWDKQRELVDSGHTLQVGCYVDDASLTFKVSESSNERYSGYYSQRKLKYYPLLSLKLQGIFSDCIIHGKCWIQASAGISEALLVPLGCCSCSQNDVEDNNGTIKYIKAGSTSQLHKSDSLFDAEATENNGILRHYNISWEYHLDTTSEAVLLERTPAIAIDYVYQLIVPDDVTSEQLSEWGSDLEYSNMNERALFRIVIGPTRMRICSGLLHRFSSLQVAASAYDYQPYGNKLQVTEKRFVELPPATEEDYDALNEQIPIRTTQLTILAPVVELQLMDHPWFEPCKGMLFRKKKKLGASTTSNISSTMSAGQTSFSTMQEVLLPKLTIECQCIDMRYIEPMYVNRLVDTVCQLPDPPMHMFRACYAETTMKVIGAYSRLILAANRHTYIVTPSSASYVCKRVFKEKYWLKPDVVHEEVTIESECFTLTGTYPKLMCIMLILDKLLKQDSEDALNIIKTSSLIDDATRDFGMVYLEICVEGIRIKTVKTVTTVTMDAGLGSVKAFIFDPIDMVCPAKAYSNLTLKNSSGSSSAGSTSSPYYGTREIQQVLFISGPESINDNKKGSDPNENQTEVQLLSVTLQYPKNPDNQPHPPIVFFNLQEMCICIDPLLCKFLLYGPRNLPPKPEIIYLYDPPPRKVSRTVSDVSASASETPRKLKTPHESIHSSSEPQTHFNYPPKIDEVSSIESIHTDIQEQIYNFLKEWFDVWKGLLLYGDVSKCTIYFPIKTLSAVGSKGIQEAVQVQITKPNPPDIMVFTLPSAVIRSSSLKQSLLQYIVTLPVTVPDHVWNKNKFTFPWTISISGLACYTYQHGRKLSCLKPVTLTATVGLSTSGKQRTSTSAGLGFQQHKDDISSVTVAPSAHSLAAQSVATAVAEGAATVEWNATVDAGVNAEYVMNLDKGIGTLSVCVHVDVTPMVITTSEIQVCLIASVVHGLNEVLTNLLPTLPTLKSDETPAPIFHERQSLVPPTCLPSFHSSRSLSSGNTRHKARDGGSTLKSPSHSSTQTGTAGEYGGGANGGPKMEKREANTLLEDSTETGVVMGEVKLTAWLQWTVARFTIRLLAHDSKDVQGAKNFTYSNEPKLKLVLDAEDIVSSLDFQNVFLKLKSKIGAASIMHFVRDKPKSKWKPGPFLGIIMRTREDTVLNENRDDINFANITITRASCNHTHNLWGTIKKPKTAKVEPPTDPTIRKSISAYHTSPPSRYITEIVVRMQPIDLILSPSTLRSYYMVLEPLIMVPAVPPQEESAYSRGRSASRKSMSNMAATSSPIDNNYNMAMRSTSLVPGVAKTQSTASIGHVGPVLPVDAQWNNRTLPLAYLECGGFRITIPSQQSLALPPKPTGRTVKFSTHFVSLVHDTCIFQVDQITVSPQAVNPICRAPIRPDIYQRAAQMRVLNIPGSDLEDRQYQLDITAIGFNTGKWSEFSPILDIAKSNGSKLKTMSENPALEWNSLGKNGLGNVQHLNLWPIISKFDVSIVAAPAMVYKKDIICGHSIEWNFVSDILFTLSLSQVKLASALMNECSYVFDMLFGSKPYVDRPKVVIPYPKFATWVDEFSEDRELDIVELTRDSGFETSDLKSAISVSVKTQDHFRIRKKSETDKMTITPVQQISSFQNDPPAVPFDVLITAGKFSFVLYDYEYTDGAKADVKFSRRHSSVKKKQMDSEKGYDASEEGSIIDELLVHDAKKFKPLLYLSFQQPNAFLSQLQLGQKVQISVFDIRIKVSGPEYYLAKGIPTESDFPIHLLETKPGEPHPDTGILPAFFTVKFSKGLGKAPTLELAIAKPTKMLCSMERWKHLLDVYKQIFESYRVANVTNREITANLNMNAPFVSSISSRENYSKFSEIKKNFCGISVLNIRLAQMLFTFKTKNGMELNLCFGKLNDTITITNRPERVTKIVHLDCVTVFMKNGKTTHLLLNPWSLSFEISMFWEPWQSADSDPQLQISVDSEAIMVDISPEHIKTLKVVLNEANDFIATMRARGYVDPLSDIDDLTSEQHEESNVNEDNEAMEQPVHEKEQHYKDDLRAGAFQFVDANGGALDELPLPYQVMFWTRTVSAMAWRYPQPRALTKVRVFPVPFKLSSDSTMTLNSPSAQLLGNQPQQVLCSLEYWSDCHGTYQPYANFQLSETEMHLLELPKCRPQPAVACVWRVVLTNPYGFARVLVSPRALAGCVRVDSYFNKHLVPNLTLAMNISTIHISLYNHFNKEVDVRLPDCLKNYTLDAVIPENQCFLTVAIDNINVYLATWNFKTALVDVTSSIKCNVLDYMFLSELPLLEPFTSRLELSYSKCLGISFVSKPIQIKIGAAIAHTLAVSAQMWEQSWKVGEDNTTTEPVDIIIMTHYVICNDTNLNLRFGQAGHEDIFLPSRCCHLYSWRSQKYKQMLRIALEELRWIWSEPFRIDTDGTDMIHIPDEKLTIVVTVKSLSATQKQVIFSGQLIICNTLLEHFELKVLEAVEQDKEKIFKSSQSYIVGGKTTPPSILIDQSKKYMLRLRFFGLESAWTGDIPLLENTKCAQPWLVKVPLQERGQFLSIWCRIVVQKFPKGKKILAMLWPLFMVRSNLPVSAKVHIETPTLNVHLESTVKGRGEIQQLYCPGTIDHSHQLTFQLDSVTPTSNPYVPLNYSLVDQNNFFKKADNEDINEILWSIAKYEKATWPYFTEEDEFVDYIIEDQPLTQVQVRYQNACQYSSALLVELLPWCLLVNSLGCTVALIVNEKELCRINHKGILAPPMLEETFYLGVGIGGTWNLSLPLQVANSDWGQSFYMPKISGTIPLEGCIETGITCGPYICMVCINSSIVNEIRLLKVASTHVLTSHLNFKLRVACFAVPGEERDLEMPTSLEQHSVIINPNLNETNNGISIIQWLTIGNVELTSDFVLYMTFSIGDKYGWSCPIRVDKTFIKTSFVVKTRTMIAPLLLISQESKGQYFLSIHHDVYPQLLIENNSGIELFCAQMSTLKESNVIVPECVHFRWIYSVEDSVNIYYTMPSISEKFPEIPQTVASVENLVLATDPEGDPQGFLWSNPINVTNFNEQFVRIPYFGDVKVSVLNIIHTVRILIQSVSQAEISARDIRVRLSLHETEPSENKPNHLNIKDTNSDSTNVSSYFSAEESSGGHSTPRQISAHSLSESRRVSTVLDQNSPYSTAFTKNDTKEYKPKNEIVKHHHRELAVRRVLTIPTDGCCEKNENNTISLLRLLLFIKRITVTLTSDLEDGGAERTEVASVALDNVGVTTTKGNLTEMCISLTELQVDNQMHSRRSFDFPVVLIGQKDKTNLELKSLNVPIMQLILEAQQHALLKIDVNIESWKDYVLRTMITDIRDVHVTLLPLSAYIEDTFYYKLRSHLYNLQPSNLVLWRDAANANNSISSQTNMSMSVLELVHVPQAMSWSAAVLSRPLILSAFTIEPLSVLLSVHSSVKMYIALDHSPLNFGRFGKKRIITTSYRLGHALTMHYLSGALFGAGWVVGSLELLGSPGGLARAMGSGLRDFVTYPYHGIVQGPWAFLKGVTHGSASLMRHVTAGTLQSVTKLASSVARNLDRLTLDEEHVRRTEEQRRQRPQGLAQGLIQGLTGFGISLLGAVGGIAHHPLQSLLSQGGATPRSLAAGVGLGLVGVITKPLSGAAELVALTGEGLLQGAGWNTLPEPRSNPILHHMFSSCNSSLKYQWKFLQSLAHSSIILFAMDATAIHGNGIGNGNTYEAVSLILTADALIVVNVDEDMTQRVLSLSELTNLHVGNDPTLLNLRLQEKEKDKADGAKEHAMEKDKGGGKDGNIEDNLLGEDPDPDLFTVEMDEACRERVEDYVRNTVGIMQLSDQQQQHASVVEHSDMSISPDEGSPQRTVIMTEDVAQSGRPPVSTLTFYVNPQSRNYFLCLFSLAKQQLLGNRFSVL